MGDKSEIKQFILESLRDPDVVRTFSEHILEHVLTPALKFQDEEIGKLKKSLAEKDAEIQALKLQVDEIEQYSRKYCLNIKGLAENEDEDPIEVVTELAAKVGVPLSRTDIDRAHRIGTSKSKDGARLKNANRDLVIKFTNFDKRKDLWAARKKVTESTASERRTTRQASTSRSGVFITENLTKYRSQIMYHARELKRDKKIWAAWTDEGIMKIRKAEGSKTQVIRSMEELKKAAANKA